MTRKLLGMVALLCLLVLASQTTADQGERTDNAETTLADQIGGIWEVFSVEFMGQKMNLPKGQEQTLTFSGGKVTMNQATRNETGSYKLNEAQSLKEIDLIVPKNGNAAMTETMKGIYQINGDTLKLAFGFNGPMDKRPTGWDAKDIGVIIMKRKR